jgi:hypothetical protein
LPGTDDEAAPRPAGAGQGHLFGSTDKADSAGLPWQGRTFEQTPSSDDDGSADPALLAALAAFAADPSGERAVTVVEAFRAARLLVPLLAHAGDVGRTADGHLVDKTQELSIATVSAPDGRAVLPAFTSVQTLVAWNPAARPVPAAGPRVALAAASEQTELVVVDPTSATEHVLRRPAVKALATAQAWRPPFDDPEVIDAFRASVAPEPAVKDVTLAPGDPAARLRGAEVEVTLGLIPGLDAGTLQTVVGRLSERWAQSAVIAERVDSMTVRLRSA